MTNQKDFQINEEQCKQFLQQQEALTKAKQAALQKSVDTLKEELELSDFDCTEMLFKSGVVKITSVKASEPRMYVYNDKTQLWDLKGSMPKVNKAIHTILKAEADKKLAQLEALFNSNNAPQLKQLADCKKKVRGALGSMQKMQNIFKAAGDCMCSESDFNKKMLKDNLIPIRTGCLDLTTLEERPRTKEDMFNFCLDVAMTDKTDDAEKFLRPYLSLIHI